MLSVDAVVYRGDQFVALAKARPVRQTPHGVAGIVFGGRVYPLYRLRHEGVSVDICDPAWSKDREVCPIARSMPPFADDAPNPPGAVTPLKPAVARPFRDSESAAQTVAAPTEPLRSQDDVPDPEPLPVKMAQCGEDTTGAQWNRSSLIGTQTRMQADEADSTAADSFSFHPTLVPTDDSTNSSNPIGGDAQFETSGDLSNEELADEPETGHVDGPPNYLENMSARGGQALRRLLKESTWDDLIAEFARSPLRLRARLKHMRNVGRTTIREIETLLTSVTEDVRPPAGTSEAPGQNSPPQNSSGRSDEGKHLESLVRTTAEVIPFFSVLLEHGLSTRLTNALTSAQSESALPSPSVLAFITNEVGFQSFILGQRGMGRTTRAEIKEVTSRVLAKRLGSSMAITDAQDVAAAAVRNPRSVRYLGLIELFEPGSLPDTAAYATSPVQSPSEALRVALSVVSDREREILERRYGLGGCSPETLETLALQAGVTRERIRQIEHRGRAKLAHGACGQGLRHALTHHRDAIWTSLKNSAQPLVESQFSDAMRRNPEIALSIDGVFGGLRGWLKEHAFHTQAGWFLDSAAAERFDVLVGEIAEYVRSTRLPCALPRRLLERHPIPDLDAAARTAGPYRIFRSYLCVAPVASRLRRAIRLHNLLSSGDQGPSSIHELLAEYRRAYRDDQCSARDAVIVMADAPHLFQHLAEDVWCSLGATSAPGESEAQLADEPEPEERDSIPPSPSLSISSVLETILTERGPTRFTELRHLAMKQVRSDTALSSIGVLLITSARFVRVAPAHYGLPMHISRVADGSLFCRSFLEEDQCRWFVTAMRAGCVHGDFPAWNRRLEYELCRWAQTADLPNTLFESLLAVVEPGSWNVSAGERAYWLRQKSLRSAYHLDIPTPDFGEHQPTAERLLAAGLFAQSRGRLCWVDVARILGKRIDFAGGATVLAMLVAAGVLLPSVHWQAPHLAAPSGIAGLAPLLSSMTRSGQAQWTDPSGRQVLDGMRQATATGQLGWVSSVELVEILDVLSGELDDGSDADAGNDDRDPLEVLLEASRARRRTDNVARTLATLYRSSKPDDGQMEQDDLGSEE